MRRGNNFKDFNDFCAHLWWQVRASLRRLFKVVLVAGGLAAVVALAFGVMQAHWVAVGIRLILDLADNRAFRALDDPDDSEESSEVGEDLCKATQI